MDYTTALSTISTLPSTKEQLKVFSHKLKTEILANNKDPLKILVQLKYIEKVIADILKDKEVDYHFLKEFLLYEKEKEINVNGATLRQQETGVKYDYDACGDPIWFDLIKQINELTEKRKEREKFLQALPHEGTVDPGTGVFINKPPKSSHTKVIVKI